MLKRICGAMAVTIAFVGLANAAEALSQPVYLDEQYLSASPIAYWDGFYVGAQLGYGAGRTANEWWNESTPTTPDGDIEYQSLVGGLHVGYQVQQDALVLGAEADLSVGNFQGNDSTFAGRLNDIQISALSTLRGRAGWANDNWLFYATGGVAAARFEKRDVLYGSNTPQLALGWTIGAGVEMAVTEHLRVRAEFLHVRLGEVQTSLGYIHRAVDPYVNIARLGVGYKF